MKSKSDRIRALPLDVPACEVAKRVGVSHQLVSAVRKTMPRPPTVEEAVEAIVTLLYKEGDDRAAHLAWAVQGGAWRKYLAGGTDPGGA